MNLNSYRQAMDQIRMSDECTNEILDRMMRESGKNQVSPIRRTVVSIGFGVLIIMILGFAAYVLGGYEVFRNYFSKDSAVVEMPQLFTYMDFVQLAVYQSTPTGRLIDDDEIAIDVVGIIGNENVADVMLDITFKQLKDLSFPNYQYTLLLDGVLLQGMSDLIPIETENMPSNCQRIMFELLSTDQISGKTLTLRLRGLRQPSVDTDKAEKLFNYGYELSIPLTFTGKSKIVVENQTFRDGMLHQVLISPLSCTLEFDEITGRKIMDNGIGDLLVIQLKNNKIIDWRGHFTGAIAAQWVERIRFVYTFRVPLDPADIESITFDGIPLSLE